MLLEWFVPAFVSCVWPNEKVGALAWDALKLNAGKCAGDYCALEVFVFGAWLAGDWVFGAVGEGKVVAAEF